jgi:hypothetical protein
MTPSCAVIAEPERRKNGPQLTDDGYTKQIDDEDFGAICTQLFSGQIRQHDSDEKTDQCSDAERLCADMVDVGGDLTPRNALGPPQQLNRINHNVSEQQHGVR